MRGRVLELAAFGQAPLALSCANGTDAIALPLMAWGIGKGDAVFCPSFTFTATPEVVPWVDATPVFVDVLPDTFNLDPAKLEAAIQAVKAEGKLKPAVVIAVDLFGQPADYPLIRDICDRHGLKLIADSAQGFGCTLHGKHPIHWADAATTSFFPAKPLGCYGDGGAVLVKDQGLWNLMDSYRVHGKAVAGDNVDTAGHDPKYINTRIGMNSRLDTIQAAILIEKLAIKVHQSGWEFDTILCLARGGMRPGDILSRIFDKPLAIMSTSSYRADAGTVQGHLDIARFITTPKGEIAGRVLLVDDLADTGHTLKAVVNMLKTNYAPITELRTAVLWTKGVSDFKADYSVDFLPTNPWIHQPFEGYDSTRPEKLLEKWKV